MPLNFLHVRGSVISLTVEKLISANAGLGYISTHSFSMGFTNSVKACSTSLRELRATLMPLLGKQEDAFVIMMLAESQLKEEAKVVELEVVAPPLYLPLTVASLAL